MLKLITTTVLFIILLSKTNALSGSSDNDLTDTIKVRINKCCEIDELFMQNYCAKLNRSNVVLADEVLWKPIFTNAQGKTNINVNYFIATGSPDCGSHQQWPIYHYEESSDVLRLLPNGVLRHYIHRPALPGEEYQQQQQHFEQLDDKKKKVMFHDYTSGQYCLDKRLENGRRMEYALVCAPEQNADWTATEFLMRNIINPITHLLTITCLTIIAIVYFVMPTLKDLVGNILTTICVCLIVSQVADLIRMLTIFTNHISLIITETICYISLLGAFFWLNSLAYYIWKTFKSRNVYLRITDSKKYCYYSAYAWLCTGILGFLAVFAHYTMDYDTHLTPIQQKLDEQEQIGSLGIIIFFMPVAFTILIDVFFIATTIRVLNRMNTYGRIHHKLKHSFRMFVLLFIIMSITWVFFLMSFTKFDGLIYSYLIVNAIQAPLIFYVCLFNQKHVAFLLRKTCCYTNCVCACCRPEPEIEWGDEMTAMNNGIY